MSFFSIHLELFANGKNLSDATGFIYKPFPTIEKYFLVTNYHVVTGREPKRPEMLLPNFATSPDEIQFYTLTKPDFVSKQGSIKIESEMKFLEHRRRSEGVDIAAVPIEFPDNNTVILTQNCLSLVDDIEIQVRSELFIVGFPWGFGMGGGVIPIWKRGTIASEPFYKENGIANFYIDSFTSPGMSGSPVFAVSRRDKFMVDKSTHDKFGLFNSGNLSGLDLIKNFNIDLLKNRIEEQCLKMVGIYSGRVALPANNDPNLGIVWHKELIDELFSSPVITKNPYPHISIT